MINIFVMYTRKAQVNNIYFSFQYKHIFDDQLIGNILISLKQILIIIIKIV